MASINDVYNQLVTANATLSQIGADVNAGTTATNAVSTRVNQLDTDLKAGFASTVSALNTIASALNTLTSVEVEGVKLLYYLTQQTNTMICALEHISQNTCGILTQTTIQTSLQTRICEDADAVLAIAQSAFPAAALERERFAALQAEIRRCCPPPVPPPACTYEPCPKPVPIREPTLPVGTVGQTG